jgi:signal transduction histidine kinase
MKAIESVTDAVSRVLTIKSESNGTDRVCFSIADTGTGIDPSYLDRIFDPLFTTKPRGMGMGLSICRTIIHRHCGRLRAPNGSHRGSTLSL